MAPPYDKWRVKVRISLALDVFCCHAEDPVSPEHIIWTAWGCWARPLNNLEALQYSDVSINYQNSLLLPPTAAPTPAPLTKVRIHVTFH